MLPHCIINAIRIAYPELSGVYTTDVYNRQLVPTKKKKGRKPAGVPSPKKASKKKKSPSTKPPTKPRAKKEKKTPVTPKQEIKTAQPVVVTPHSTPPSDQLTITQLFFELD